MQYSQKYALVAFFEPVKIDTQFNMADWPLHITLADVFSIELDVYLSYDFVNLFGDCVPFKISAGKEAVLGTAQVVSVDKSKELQGFHNKIVEVLELNGATFNHPEFTREGFLPHSTIQKTEKLLEGDQIEISRISLIDMFPKGDWQQRKVIHNFQLGKNNNTNSMLREFMYNSDMSIINHLLQRFGFNTASDTSAVTLLEFESLSPDSFLFRLLIDKHVYYMFAEDYIPSLDYVKKELNSLIQSENWEFVLPKEKIDFETSSPVETAEIYNKPDDAEEITKYAIDSGYDFVFLAKSSEVIIDV